MTDKLTPDDDDEIDESDDSFAGSQFFNESEECCWAGEYDDGISYLDANIEPEDEDG